MNLRITVEGKTYDVKVTVMEETATRRGPMNGPVSGLGATSVAPAAAVLAAAEASAKARVEANGQLPGKSERTAKNAMQPSDGKHEAKPEPWPERTTHHIYGPLPAKPGEVVCPVSGVIVEVIAKPGDKVKQHASLLVLEVSKQIATGERPFVGTVRAGVKGVVKSIRVKPGDKVKSGQLLCELDES